MTISKPWMSQMEEQNITYFLIYSSSTVQSYPKTMAAPLASIHPPPKGGTGQIFALTTTATNRLHPDIWQTVLKWKLRIPLCVKNGKCICGATLDEFGDHLFCCTIKTKTTTHNCIRGRMSTFATTPTMSRAPSRVSSSRLTHFACFDIGVCFTGTF